MSEHTKEPWREDGACYGAILNEYGDTVAVAHKQQDAAQAEKIKELEARCEVLTNALSDLYGKYENGDPCFEEPETSDNFMGNAVRLFEDEENKILSLIPSVLNDNGAKLPKSGWLARHDNEVLERIESEWKSAYEKTEEALRKRTVECELAIQIGKNSGLEEAAEWIDANTQDISWRDLGDGIRALKTEVKA